MARATAHPDHHLVSSEDVEGTYVYGPDGTKIGEIDHLMIDKESGRITYAVISFGGFLGLGHSHYPVPWSALKYDRKLMGYVTSITQEQLKDALAFSDDAWSDRDWQESTMDVPTVSDVGTCPHRHEVIKAFGEVSDPVLVDLASMGAR